MGKKGKALRSKLKAQKKRAVKQANRAKYAAWKAAGENTKSFRGKKRLKKKKGFGEKGKHLIADCGNVGCLKCNPVERKPKVVLNRRQSLQLIKKMFPDKPKKLQRGQKRIKTL